MFSSRRRTFTAADRERKYAAILASCDMAPPRSIVTAIYGPKAETAFEREQRENGARVR